MANTDLDLGNDATAANNLKLRADGAGGGSICNGAGTELVKVPAGGVPAFRAYATGVTSITGAYSKVALAGESFDTASAFASDKFTPQVAGYYQINGAIGFATSSYVVQAKIYKNGESYATSTTVIERSVSISDVVYLNGSTDYVELYGYSATTQNCSIGADTTYFSGILIKAT